MQNKTLLSGLLAVQVALAAALFASNLAGSSNRAPMPWLAFPTSNITRIVIADVANSTSLTKEGENWQMPEQEHLPASGSRVSSLLTSLSALSTRWPVVSSASGRERFEVSDEKFQRHLQLFKGEELVGDYYFGTSPGFRQTHARRAGEDEVYALAFNNFDLPADANDWLDKNLLQVKDLTAITGSDYTLNKNGEVWELATGQTPDTTGLENSKALALATALQNLQVLRLATPAEGGETHTVSVQTGTAAHEFRFTKVGSEHYVQRLDKPQVFTLTAAEYDRIAPINRAALLQTPPSTEVVPAVEQPAPATEDAKAGD